MRLSSTWSALAELEVEGAERLVEEQHVGPVDERPGQRHPLLLAAGQLVRLALLVAGEMDELERLADAPVGSRALSTPSPAQPEGDVVADVRCGKSA